MAKNFWGTASNGRFTAGCTGQTVYIYDAAGQELARFKDIIYAYTPLFSPVDDLLVVKSTAGMMAAYDLSQMVLVKKFRFSNVPSQDDGFCFSPDGKLLYNIERHGTSCRTRLSIYDTSDFSCSQQLFADDQRLVLNHIEYDPRKTPISDTIGRFFVLGFLRSESGPIDFVAELKEGKLLHLTAIGGEEHHFLHTFKSLQMRGFPKRWLEDPCFPYPHVDPSREVWLSDYM